MLLCAMMFVTYLNCIVDRNIHCRREQISEYCLDNVLVLMFHKESEGNNFMVTEDVSRCVTNCQAYVV
jgi:hypothetical protein